MPTTKAVISTATCGVSLRWWVLHSRIGTSRLWAMSSRIRAAAVMQASRQANILIIAPASMMRPSTGTATWFASTCIGASVLSTERPAVAKAKHFRIRSQDEENPRAQRALQNCARYGA